ncbi:TPA: phage antirepressor N-terminal domain-containing protein, partial [Pasteurella multocida]
PEQILMAVEYIHRIVLEGELITDTSPKVKENEIVVPYNVFYSLYKHGQRGRQLGYEVSILLDSLLKLLGAEYGRPKLTGLAYDC